MRIIRVIVDAKRDPEVLAASRDVRCRSSIDMIKVALVGNDSEEHVFAQPNRIATCWMHSTHFRSDSQIDKTINRAQQVVLRDMIFHRETVA